MELVQLDDLPSIWNSSGLAYPITVPCLFEIHTAFECHRIRCIPRRLLCMYVCTGRDSCLSADVRASVVALEGLFSWATLVDDIAGTAIAPSIFISTLLLRDNMWKDLREHHADTATCVDAGVEPQALGKSAALPQRGS
jgi:hypothetical protein